MRIARRGAAICIALSRWIIGSGSVTSSKHWRLDDINSAGIYAAARGSNMARARTRNPLQAKQHRQCHVQYRRLPLHRRQDGFLYAFCMKVPAAGAKITITSLGTNRPRFGPHPSVSLLAAAPPCLDPDRDRAHYHCPAAMPSKRGRLQIGPANLAKAAAATEPISWPAPDVTCAVATDP